MGGSSSNSKGVAILFNSTFEYEITDIIKDKDGRYIMLNLLINNLSARKLNPYGKSHNCQITFIFKNNPYPPVPCQVPSLKRLK